MTALDDKMVPLALNMIAKFGKAVTFRTIERVYDPVEGETANTPTEVAGTVTPPAEYDRNLVDGDTIQARDLRISVAASGLTFTPVVGMEVDIGGDTYRVVNVRPIYSGESVAMYSLQVRHGGR